MTATSTRRADTTSTTTPTRAMLRAIARLAIVRSAMALPVIALPAIALLAGCHPQGDLPLPDGGQVEAYYDYENELRAEVSGNVAVVTVAQRPDQLRTGGRLWAKVGPYVFLFSEETRRLFDDFAGLAGVRVITTVDGTEVANAVLARDELTDVLWRRSINIAGRARRDGTGRMTLLEDLVEWGEEHTEFTYNPTYVSR